MQIFIHKANYGRCQIFNFVLIYLYFVFVLQIFIFVVIIIKFIINKTKFLTCQIIENTLNFL